MQSSAVDESTSLAATPIEAPCGKPIKNNKDQNSKAPQATHVQKHRQIYAGRKVHVASDLNTSIKDDRLDTARVHDINHFEALADGAAFVATRDFEDDAVRGMARLFIDKLLMSLSVVDEAAGGAFFVHRVVEVIL